MIGGLAERRTHWLQALVVSLALHGAAAAAILDVIPALPRDPAERAPVQIEVAALDVAPGSIRPAALSPAEPVAPAQGQAVTPSVAETGSSVSTPAVASEVLSPAEDLQSVIVPAPATLQGVTTPRLPGFESAALAPEATNAPRADVRRGAGTDTNKISEGLASLIGSIREQLAQPCLLALPRAADSDRLRLTLLGEDPARFAPLIEALEPPQGVALSQEPLLVDTRQCPAVNFARAYRSYPVYPLRIALDSAEIVSGGALTGSISGFAEGRTPVLLLIDDNGVVQDLTRFFTARSTTSVAFDVPARRSGDPRETSKLLLALTSAAPLKTIAERDGQAAADFFAALSDEVTDPAALRMGLATFDLR